MIIRDGNARAGATVYDEETGDMMSNAADLLMSALAERDEARAAADVQASEIARLMVKADAYERQIVALKIDLAEATALMRATVDEAKNVAAEHDKLSDQVRQLASTIEAGIEQSAAAERAALQGVAEYDAAVARAEAAEASAAAMRSLIDAGRALLDRHAAELAQLREENARLTTLANNERAAWEIATLGGSAARAILGRAVAALRDNSNKLLQDEIAAHARTQAKLADVEARLLASQGAAAAMRDWCAAWLIRARLAVYREGWEEGMSATEAADALTSVLFNLGCDDVSERSHDITETKRLLAMPVTYAPPSGRAIAERVPMWRELETLVRSLSGGVIPVGCLIDVVLRKLAALDAKGGR